MASRPSRLDQILNWTSVHSSIVEEPHHLEDHPTATAKEKLERNKRIEAIRAINVIITRLKAKLMEIIQDRVSNEMIATFNALGSDPYLAYKWLCRNHGPESQGITEKISMYVQCIHRHEDEE